MTVMLFNRFLWLLKVASLGGTIAALLVAWVSDMAVLLGRDSILGVPVFDVRDSRKLAVLLFPGAVVLVLLFLVERRWGLGQSKREAVRQYVRRLPDRVARRYGRRRHYTRDQIMCTVRAERLCPAYVEYAVALFGEPNGRLQKDVRNGGATKSAVLRKEALSLLGTQGAQLFKGEGKNGEVLDAAAGGNGEGGGAGDCGDG